MPTIAESAQRSAHGTWIEIRLDRLISNLQLIRKQARAGVQPQVMAVVKANAYGHGLIGVARAVAGEVSYLGVSSVGEAIELKEHGIEAPIFLFGCLFPHEIRPVLKEGITLSVSSFDEAREISFISESLDRNTTVHIKIDTGMGRLGIPFRDAINQIEKMTALPGLNLEGIYTHFPTAEADDGFSEKQLYHFGLLLQALDAKGIRFRYRHASNSAGSLKIKSPILNLIRPGLMMYGLYPSQNLKPFAPVEPVLSFKSRIILVKKILPGESVGYGRDFVAQVPTIIATLPVGYSHGYPFSASNKASVLFRGKRYPIAGRVSMDYISVNLGNTEARVGDEITLLGEDAGATLGAEEIAQWANTIPYEIVTQLASRLPRVYLQ